MACLMIVVLFASSDVHAEDLLLTGRLSVTACRDTLARSRAGGRFPRRPFPHLRMGTMFPSASSSEQ